MDELELPAAGRVLEVSIELPKERPHGKKIEIQEGKPGTVH